MADPDVISRESGGVDFDPIAFRNAVLRHLANDDDEGLRRDGMAVMAPLFVERFIEEIAPGNPWNDVLFLMSRRLLDVSPELRYLSPILDQKKRLVRRPDASFDEVVLLDRQANGISVRLRD